MKKSLALLRNCRALILGASLLLATVVCPSSAPAAELHKDATLSGTTTITGTFTLPGGITVTPPALGGQLVAKFSNQVFVFDGDSLTAPNSGADWPAQAMLLSQFAGLGTAYNYAVTGNGITDLAGRYVSSVKPHRPAVAGTQRSVLFVWVGANDYNTADTASWLTAWGNYIATAKADGFYVVAFTIMKRNGAGWSDWETSRLAMNAGIRASTAYDLLIDVDAIFPDPNNIDFFNTDKTHLIASADVLLAGAVNAALDGNGRTIGYAGNLLALNNTFTGKNTLLNTDSSGLEPLSVQQNNAGYVQTWYYNGTKIADIHPLGILEIPKVTTTGDVTVGGTLHLNGAFAMAVNSSDPLIDVQQNGGGYVQVWRDSGGNAFAHINPGAGGYFEINMIKSINNLCQIDFSTSTHIKLTAQGTEAVDVTAAKTTINNVLHLTPQATPGSAAEGDVYANSSDHHLYFHNGTAWVQLDN
jgi:hypothetical protein